MLRDRGVVYNICVRSCTTRASHFGANEKVAVSYLLNCRTSCKVRAYLLNTLLYIVEVEEHHLPINKILNKFIILMEQLTRYFFPMATSGGGLQGNFTSSQSIWVYSYKCQLATYTPSSIYACCCHLGYSSYKIYMVC